MQTSAVDLNSFTFTWQFFTHKQKYYRETLATPTFLSRVSPLLCCRDALKLHVSSNCVSDLGDSYGQMQGHVGIIAPGNKRVSVFPGSLDAAKVLCGLQASMDTFSFTTFFADLSQTFLCKSTNKIHTLNRSCGCSST